MSTRVDFRYRCQLGQILGAGVTWGMVRPEFSRRKGQAMLRVVRIQNYSVGSCLVEIVQGVLKSTLE